MIEAVVDLDGIEMLRVKGEHVLSRKLLWVKDAEPVFVIPSGCSDVNLPHHDLNTVDVRPCYSALKRSLSPTRPSSAPVPSDNHQSSDPRESHGDTE